MPRQGRAPAAAVAGGAGGAGGGPCGSPDAAARRPAEKRIGASLQAHPTVYAGADLLAGMQGVDPAELFITSGATLVEGDGPADAYRLAEVPGVAVTPGVADGAKCERCWRVLPEVAVAEPVCERCADAVSTTLDAAE